MSPRRVAAVGSRRPAGRAGGTETTRSIKGAKSAESAGRCRPGGRSLHEVATDDGVRLIVEHVPAVGEAVGAVWVGHAFLANRRSLDRPRGAGFGSALVQHGLEVYLADMRGHGATARLDPDTRDTWSYRGIVRYDLPALTRFVRGRHPSLGVGAIGHSLTGHGLLAHLSRSASAGDPTGGLDAVVSIAGANWLPSTEPSRPLWWLKRAIFEAMALLPRWFGRLPARRLGVGSEDASRAFVDELCRFARTDVWSTGDDPDYRAGLLEVETPVLAIAGRGDRLLCREASWRLFHAPLRHKTLRCFGRAETGFDPGHMELLTDPRSRPIWHEVGRWLAGRLLQARAVR